MGWCGFILLRLKRENSEPPGKKKPPKKIWFVVIPYVSLSYARSKNQAGCKIFGYLAWKVNYGIPNIAHEPKKLSKFCII